MYVYKSEKHKYMSKNRSPKPKESERKKNTSNQKSLSIGSGLKQETKYSVFAVVCFVLALFFFIAAFGKGGPAGNALFSLFTFLFGIGYFLIPVLLVILGFSFIQSQRPSIAISHTLGSVFFLFSTLGLLEIGSTTHRGGMLGQLFAWPFTALFETSVSVIFLCGLLIISLIVLFDTRPNIERFLNFFRNLFSRKDTADEDESIPDIAADTIVEIETPEMPTEEKLEPTVAKLKEVKSEEEAFSPKNKFISSGAYVPPPLSLLEKDKGKPNVGDIKANSNIIKRTLQNFGIEVEMDEITIGPSVTRYALKPAEGMKLSRIVGLQNDLALALAAHPLRIEAPIPGKSLVGIEIPNRTKSIVGLASLLSHDKFQNAAKPLMVALGRNIAGQPIVGDMAKMPHCLVAGATGSGKSVTIHAIITSLLYRNGPEDLRFIMVDPKRVELTLYNKIPHLLTPVITEPKKAILALKWAAKEMERRYDILEKNSVRDITSYHGNIVEKYKGDDPDHAPDRMPYIVIIIDELADIMQSYPRELESAIVRLAQMSRAVGIHLLLSTQRPSVNVITGLIKANIPARIALQVASQIDSRTILDQAGAEKLLGAGDMLYSSGEMASPERLQCAFISEDEVKKVVKYIADMNSENVPSDITIAQNGGALSDKSIFTATLESGDEPDDDMYEEARQIVIETGKASTSFLQRKLGIGYSRAARLIDMLEEKGIIGPGNGSKPREVLEKTSSVESQEYH